MQQFGFYFRQEIIHSTKGKALMAKILQRRANVVNLVVNNQKTVVTAAIFD